MKFFKFLTCALLLAACSNHTNKNSEDQTESSSPLTLPVNFYKKLKGKIGDDIFITMDLIKRRDSLTNQNSLSGHYYYDKIGMPLELYGTMSDSVTFELSEMDAKGETTGKFEGKFISATEARGTWTNPKTKKQYPFILKAEEGTDNLFAFNEYYNENCKGREICMRSTRKDTLNWTDTMCCSMHVSLVTLADEKNTVSKKINDAIIRNLLSTGMGEKAPGSVNQLLHSIDEYGVGDILEAEYTTGIVSNEGNILCISVSEWENSGGAHPNGASYFLNFDKRTGDTLSLLEILLPETIDELVYRSKQQFIKENGPLGKDSDWFFGEEFAMPRTFSIGRGGLLFQYQSYEAAPYAAGMPQFFISWNQIKDIVKPEYLQ